MSNARDATEGPGTLCIELRSIDASSEPALANGRLSPGEYAIVSVTDSGSGMPPDVVKKAFEPFFTTKGQEGTGLGLATAYGIAQQSGGTIDIESRVGVGTTVRLYLPITHRRPKKREEPGLGPETGGGYERILVVEDQKAVGRLIRTALEDEGYEVHVAEDGIEGGEIYEREGPFDLVISDVILPRATGPEMVEKLEAGGHRPARDLRLRLHERRAHGPAKAPRRHRAPAQAPSRPATSRLACARRWKRTDRGARRTRPQPG